MPGRRWSDGLHQAVEAKEKVKIERENQTLATITFQNYFRMYGKLAGMTGTAETEAPEFDKIYKLDVLVIPTNRPLIRVENPDVVYRTEREKFDAVVKEIQGLHESGRPALVGTISIEKSEHLSTLLKKAGIKHVVLNAKYHEREAEIVAQAGRFGAVTIATNMAGRGTDIILGGVPDHRAKALLAEKMLERKQDPGARQRRGRAHHLRPGGAEMAAEFKRELQQRKPTPEQRSELARRYLGLMASFAPDHPSVLTVRALASDGSAARPLSRHRPRPAPGHQGEDRQGLLPPDREPRGLPRGPPAEVDARRARRPRPSSPRSRPCSTPTSASASSRSAACTSSAPSATRPAASTTSCAAAPAARATRAPRASTSRSRTT